jgi:hypothetical protein
MKSLESHIRQVLLERANASASQNMAGAEKIKMEDAGVPNEGNERPTSVSYGPQSEDGKKKKVKEDYSVKDAADDIADVVVPYWSASKKFAKGDYVGAGIDATVDTALGVAAPFTGGASWGARIAGKTALKAGEKAAVKAGEKEIVKTGEKAAEKTVVGDTAKTALKVGANALLGGGGSKNSETITPGQAVSTSAPKTGASAQYTPSRKSKTVKEEAEGTKYRKTVENVGRPDTAKNPFDKKSKIGKQAEIQRKIIDENKKLAGVVKDVVKQTKEEASEMGGAKKKEYPQVTFNPSLEKPHTNETV